MSTPPAHGRAHRRILCALVLGAAAVLPATASAATPSPEDVRACVELNLPRYSDPGSAVAAQYADAETSCKAGLADGSVSVQFDPGASGGGTPPAATTTDQGTTAPPDDGADEPGAGGGATTTAPAAPGSGAAPASGAGGKGATTTPKPATTGSERLVAGAIASADAGPGSPLPSSLSGGSAWLLILIGGAAVLIAGAAAVAVRRRLH